MFCPKCGTQNNDGAKFCASCGTTFSSNSNMPNNMPNNMSTGSMPSQAPSAYQYTPVAQQPGQKKSKAPIIAVISIIAVLLIAVIVLLCVHFIPSDDDSGSSSKKSDRESLRDKDDDDDDDSRSSSKKSDRESSKERDDDDDKSDRRDDSESKEKDKEPSKEPSSSSASSKGARSAQSALDNLLIAINITDRDMALDALHPIYETALTYGDADYIYDFISYLATEDMYLILVDTLDIPVPNANVQEEIEGLELYFFDYDIDDQMTLDTATVKNMNDMFEFWYDDIGYTPPNTSDWQIGACEYYTCTGTISAYGDIDEEEFEVLIGEINGAWYVLALDF